MLLSIIMSLYCYMLSCIIETLQKPLYFNRKQLHENASVEKIKNKQISLCDKT